jgi:hypothetical protein
MFDNKGNLMKNCNQILMKVSLYSTDNPPVRLKTTNKGGPIVSSAKDSCLVKGECSMNKVHINEVTSHYRNGVVFLVIAPSKKNFNTLIPDDKLYVDYREIKPLIVENVRVKAKMPKRTDIDC